MPNHCLNTLRVSGNKEDLDKFKNSFLVKKKGHPSATYEIIHRTPSDIMHEYSPLPKKDGETDIQYNDRMSMYKKMYGADNWYDWRLRNWGTKWDIYDFNLDTNTETELMCIFNSAWSPPLGWFEKAVERYPSLVFYLDYIEEGNSFCGLASGLNGECTNEYADIEYLDDNNGQRVTYNQDKMCYVYGNGQEINDEDFWPIAINPLVY